MTARDRGGEPPLTTGEVPGRVQAAALDVPYQQLNRRYHAHQEQGQKMRHAHPGGDQPHGYYEHPEDPDPDRGCPL